MFLTMATTILATACSQPGDPAGGDNASALAIAPESTRTAAAASPGMPVATPTPTAPPTAGVAPVPLTPDAERGEKGARNVLLAFARAVEQGDYGAAWSLLAPADRRKWSRAAFAALFADLRRPTVAVPTGTIEGAAGSSYYTAPVTVTGTGRDGRPVRLDGEAVLRRVNDVDGASAAQLRWHFERLTLDRTH